MLVKSLELENFRNYQKLQIEFDPVSNILSGDNAQGKTNILEALYLCAVTKSHRGSKDRDMIAFGQEEAHIKCIVEKNGSPDRIDIHLKKNRNKGIAVNGVPLRRASDLFGTMNAVFFSPEDLSIIKKGPSDRRRFVDMELCQLDRLYTTYLTGYNHVIQQKNQLLKDIYGNPSLKDTLAVWNEQLVRYGTQLIRLRREFVEEMNPITNEIHKNLTCGRENLEIRYEPDVTEQLFEKALIQNEDREIRMKMSLIGPHRDDLAFLADGMDIRTFGSQGQQRTTALSLKLAQIAFMKKVRKDTPILLLDDVLSELDRSRQLQLMDSIRDIQTVVTCTGVDDFVNIRFPVSKVFEVVQGTVSQITRRN